MGAQTQSGYGGEVRVAINSDIRSTNPGVRRDGNTDTVLYHVAEALVAFDDTLTPRPMLAESVSRSRDGRRYRFRLRRGVRFHNGAPMSAREVVWSWRRMLDPETGYRCRVDFDGSGPTGLKIESVEATGPHEVLFRLNQPSSLFLHRMASIQCLAAILHPDSLAEDGSWREPVATGPYRIAEWRRGERVVLERFEDYVPRRDPPSGLTGRKTAYLDRVVFQVVPDRIAAQSALYAGNLDLVFALPLSAAKSAEQRARRRGDIRVYHQDTLDWTVLLMQTRDPLLSDPRMRRAIAHAISPDLVATFGTFDYAEGNPSAAQRLSPFHTPAHEAWPAHDPERARTLAREAGYRGETLVIQANRKYSYMYDNAVAIQAMLHAAGFAARIELFDWATQLTNFFRGDFQLSSFGYSARSHPGLVYSNLIGDKSRRATVQWQDPEASRLIAAVERAGDDREMQRLLDQLHRAMQRQVPLVGLYNDHIVDITSADLAGYAPWAFGRPRLWNVRLEPAAAGAAP